jgi:iron complex outermembrane receptor protein
MKARRVLFCLLALFFATLAAIKVAAAAASTPTNLGDIVQIDAYTVTGSNLKRLDEEKALPVTRIDSEEIALIGAQSVADILQAIPQVEASVGNLGAAAGGPNDAGGDTASVNLRGLGDGNTLVLLNSRRLSVNGIAPNTPPVVFVNVNQIPAGAIERIEVLRDGASAIYGSDATGGVVNFLLKKNYSATEVRARYGAANGGYDEITSSLAVGRTLNHGRTAMNFFASFYRRDALSASDRAYSADADKRPLVSEPFATNASVNGRNSSGPYGRFSRINSYNADGTIANATTFFMQAPANGSAGADLVTGAGPTATYNSQIDKQLFADVRRTNLFATFSQALTPKIALLSEVSYYYAQSHNQASASPISGNNTLTGSDNVIVPASNYYNPFGIRLNPAAPRDVLIRNYRPVELGPRTFDVDLDSYRVLAGLQGRVGESWSWETAALYMESLTKDFQGGLISQSKFNAQLALNTPEAFNVFGGPNANAPTVVDQVRIVDWTRGTGQLTLLDTKATGNLFEFPGGPVALATGIEYREEKLRERNGPFGLADDVIAISGQIDVTARRDVYAGYAEISLPFVGGKNRRAYLNRFEFNLAGRYENFGKFSATKPKFAAQLTTVPWWTFRASTGEGFRAPSVAQLFQPPRTLRFTQLLDSARQYTSGGITITPEDAATAFSKRVSNGGNPALQPENSRSWNIGTVVEPPLLKGFSLGVDYWGIRQDDRIDIVDPQGELDKDNRLWRTSQGSNPNIQRTARTADDIAKGIPGALFSINGVYQNLGRREVQGYDLSAQYDWRSAELGRVRFRAEASRYLKFRDTDINGAITERIRQTGNPRWRETASVLWSKSVWNAGVFARYVGDYESSSSLISAGRPFVVRSWTTLNANLGYQFSRGVLRNSTVLLGANNVFDRDPPLNPSPGVFPPIGDGYDPGYANPLGRFVYLELRKKF